jgi:2C-methyl-D-erythritol 2,4-cyclodiphosphate synthase
MGLRENKTVENHLVEVQSAADAEIYYERKNRLDATLSNIADPQIRKIFRQQYNTWKDSFMAGRPMLEEYLGKGRERAVERTRALDDLTTMLNDPKFKNIRPETQDVLRQMVNAYNGYVKQKQIFELTGGDREIVDLVKSGTLSKIKSLSTFNENTLTAYNSIFSRLLGE